MVERSIKMKATISPSALISRSAKIEHDVYVWHWTQIRENAQIGHATSIGQGCYIGPGVRIGSRVRIQNGAQVYEPSSINDGAFIGPNVVFTNDLNPRAVSDSALTPITSEDWLPLGVQVGVGASIGANSVVVAPARIGRWALVAAGSVVTRDVPDFALVMGNPARQTGWVGFSGRKLVEVSQDIFQCKKTGQTYLANGGNLEPAQS